MDDIWMMDDRLKEERIVDRWMDGWMDKQIIY